MKVSSELVTSANSQTVPSRPTESETVSWGLVICVLRLPRWLSGKESACSAGDIGETGSIPGSGRHRRHRFLGQEDPLEEEMATHSSIFSQEIPWTEEPGGLSPWSCRVIT